MTPGQQTAYAHPCYEATETANQKFFSGARDRDRSYSVGLTANVGLE